MGNQYSKKLSLFRITSSNSNSSSSSSSRKKKEKEAAANQDDDPNQSPPIIPIKASVIEGWKAHHDLLKEYWGDNFIAPVDEWLKIGGFKVLDMGCGTGTWLIEMALEYPQSEFIGVDVLSLMPKRNPENIRYVQADIKLTLPFPDGYFDYIHMRHLILYFTFQEWTSLVIPEIIRVLKPGGYIELTEADMEWCNLSPTGQLLICAIHKSMRTKGVDPFMINRLVDILDSTEVLENVYQRVTDVFVGHWAGDRGVKLLKMCCDLFDNIRVAQCETLRLSNAEFDSLIQQFRDDVEIYKTYCKTYKFYAAKRLDY